MFLIRYRKDYISLQPKKFQVKFFISRAEKAVTGYALVVTKKYFQLLLMDKSKSLGEIKTHLQSQINLFICGEKIEYNQSSFAIPMESLHCCLCTFFCHQTS